MNSEKLKADASWNIADVIAKALNIRKDVAIRLIDLLEKEECTIPFIARYRKEKTAGMDPDSLRNFASLLEELRAVQKKSETMRKTLQKQGDLDPKTELALLSAQSMEELELTYAPFKGEKKSSLANRARTLGLGEAASAILTTPNKTNLKRWVTKGTEGRATLSEVETGVKHIVADLLSKEKATMDKVREVFQPRHLFLESKLAAKKKKEGDSKQDNHKSEAKSSRDEQHKYQLYYEFRCCVNNLRSHQVLAINRGESHKYLTVKLTISKEAESRFLAWSRKYWLGKVTKQDAHDLLKSSLEDSYTRLIKPFVLRKTRSDLLKKAQVEAVEIFSKNLKRLLLTPPLRGKAVLGVDPGFSHGCKCAVVSSTGNEVLATDIIHLNSNTILRKIKQLHTKHKFDVIGIGNGTGCREAESVFSQFINKHRDLDLAYCIVNENGASIYSVTEEAQKELPDLDPNLRSAVSIARRLQDPLIELVKIEPKHIGVGMYQHDIPDNQLKSALDNVIEDCVTYVGVDVNVANEALLRRIAGLKKNQAKNIVDRRQSAGNFVNRQELRQVKGIGEKTFQQCAGFLRICHDGLPGKNTDEPEPKPSGSKRKMNVSAKTRSKKIKLDADLKPNPLDQTWIHPESYGIAERFVASLDLKIESLGQKAFIDTVKKAMYETGLNRLAENLSTDASTVQLIVDGLSQEAGFRDIRNEMRRPIFRRGVTDLQSLRVGTKLSGRVTNVTEFGAFVDVGVGLDGLMHHSDSGGNWEDLRRSLGPNDTVQVSVKRVELQRKRIALRLVQADLCQTAFR